MKSGGRWWPALLMAVCLCGLQAERAAAQCTLPTGTTFTESFGNAGSACWTGGPATCNQPWKISKGTTYSIASAPAGAAPDQACTNALSLAASSSAVKLQTYGSIPRIPAGTTLDLYFSLYVTSAPSDNVTLLQLRSTVSGGTLANVVWRNAAGTYLFASGAASSGNNAISLNAWHSVQLHVDATAQNSYIAVDGGSQQAFTANAQDMNSIVLNGDVKGSYYLGNLYINAPGYGPSGSPMLVDFAGAVNGNPVSTAAMNSGSHCVNTGWQADGLTALTFSNAVTQNLHTSTNSCGTPYAGDTGMSVRFDMSSQQGATYPFTTLSPSASFGFFYYTTVSPKSQTFYCNARITGVYDYACVHQHGNGKTLQIFLEVDADPELYGAPIPILPNTWYWVTIQYNAGGTHHLRVYETQNWTLLGSSDGPSANGTDLPIRFDFGHSGSDTSPVGTYLYYSNLMLDWVNGTFPLGPGGGDVPTAPVIVSANTANFLAGSANAFIVKPTGSPVPALSAAGTPPSGVSFDPSTGILSGTPTAGVSGSYSLQFTATNDLGAAEQDFMLNVSLGQTAAPAFSPKGGSYSAVQTVTLTDTTPGAVIYYTTDGSLPSQASTAYAGPITVSASTPVTAMALAPGYNGSASAAATYTLTAPRPTFTPAAGSYSTVQSVTIADAAPGASIFYTTNGTAATPSSTPYTGPVSVSSTTTLNAMATVPGWTNSSSASSAYTINLGVPATPAFSVRAGTYSATQTVTITDNTSGASIYYTTDGTTPTANSTPYAGPVSITETTTLEAVAIASSGSPSSVVASAVYTLRPATPALSVATGTYSAAQSVTISDATTGASIFYTSDGSAPTASSTPYTGPVAISSTTTLTAIAIMPGWSNSATVSAVYTLRPAPPGFGVAAGTYGVAQSVTITDANAGAAIFYTTDGSTPTTASTPYTEPVAISGTTTLTAIAAVAGWSNSTNASAVYTLKPAIPAFSLAAGAYTTAQSVTISDDTPGVSIFYTTNGTAPTAASTPYTGAINISSTTTLMAVASITGWTNSSAASAVYTINLQAPATPTFSLAGGTYSAAQTVSISDTTAGAQIYYSVDGSTPTATSAPYAGPISIAQTTALKAVAIITGNPSSAVASATYTLRPAAPVLSLATGTYNAAQSVTLSDSTPGASIFYTTDGSTPTTASTPYGGVISITATTRLTAIAAISGWTNSTSATATYTLQAARPTLSLAAGTFTAPQSVTITDATPGASIYYTTNGSTPTTGSTPYAGPVAISSTETLTAIAAISGWSNSSTISARYTITAPATPTFSIRTGTFTTAQTVTLTDTTAGASIYYTTDNSTPTTVSALYSGPISVAVTTTLKAVASNGGPVSAVGTNTYTLRAATPTFSLAGGTYGTTESITIADATPGAAIHYTTNGTTPTAASALYTGPIAVTQSSTVEAIAVVNGWSNSATASATYTLKVPTPTFNPAAGTYTGARTVTISDSLAGVNIYYTTNGSTPTTSSTVYAGPISVPSTRTVKAIATFPGWSTSNAGSAAYTIR